jgi:hypothetical protein
MTRVERGEGGSLGGSVDVDVAVRVGQRMDCCSVAGCPAAHTNATVTLLIGHGARIHRATCVDSVTLFVLLCGSVAAKRGGIGT